MATFDEAFLTAKGQLDECGQLLNVELLRIVDRDEERFREIRESLIFHGIATDRFGVGLLSVGHPDSQLPEETLGDDERTDDQLQPSDEITFAGIDQPGDDEWRLMTAGITQGPFSLEVLQGMCQRGEITTFDLVRQGEWGVWQRPTDIDCLNINTRINPHPNEDVATKLLKPLPLSIFHQTESRKRVIESPTTAVASTVTTSSMPVIHEHTEHGSREKSDRIEEGNEYFLWGGGSSVGPYSRNEIQSRLKSGRVNADELVQVGSDGDWQPVSRALGLPRLPLRIPREKNTTPRESLTVSDAKLPHSTGWTNTPIKSASSSRERPTRVQTSPKKTPTRAKERSSEESKSVLGRYWNLAAEFVGGSRRLAMILVLSSSVMGVVFYLRQPPSSKTIYREVQAAYEKVVKVRANWTPSQTGKSSTGLADEAARIRVLRDFLKQRATADRRGDQELLWACDHGLLLLLEHPDSEEFNSTYLFHIANAALEIDSPSASNK